MKILIFLVAMFVISTTSATEIVCVDEGVLHACHNIEDADGDGIPLHRTHIINVEDDGTVETDIEGFVDICPNIPNLNNEQAYCDMDLNNDGYITIVDLVIARLWDDHPAALYGYGGNACFWRIQLNIYNSRLFNAGLPVLLYGVVGVPPHCTNHHTYPIID